MVDNFSLGFDNGSLGDTKVYVVSIGHTWTLSPTLLLDGNFGYNRQNQQVTGPDFGKNLGHRSRDSRHERSQGHPGQRPAHLRQWLHHRHDAQLDAAVSQGDQLQLQQRADEGLPQA